MIADVAIRDAAEELFERHGANAVRMAEERVTTLSAGRDQASLSIALRVLTALESLVEGRRTRNADKGY